MAIDLRYVAEEQAFSPCIQDVRNLSLLEGNLKPVSVLRVDSIN